MLETELSKWSRARGIVSHGRWYHSENLKDLDLNSGDFMIETVFVNVKPSAAERMEKTKDENIR